MTMRLPMLLALAATAALLLAAPSMGARTPSVAVHSSAYGKILFDDRGFVLYSFTRDGLGSPSRCSGTCAKAWPPFIVTRAPVAGKGAVARLVGTLRRPDGRLQVAYGGRPLYYYVGDRSPGQILCQDVTEYGGRWLVVRPTGLPVG